MRIAVQDGGGYHIFPNMLGVETLFLIPLVQPAMGFGVDQADVLFLPESAVHGIWITVRIAMTITSWNREHEASQMVWLLRQ